MKYGEREVLGRENDLSHKGEGKKGDRKVPGKSGRVCGREPPGKAGRSTLPAEVIFDSGFERKSGVIESLFPESSDRGFFPEF